MHVGITHLLVYFEHVVRCFVGADIFWVFPLYTAMHIVQVTRLGIYPCGTPCMHTFEVKKLLL